LDDKFDANAFIAKARNEMLTTKNADYGAWVGTAIAKIEKFNLEHKDEINANKKVDANSVEVAIRTIKKWLADPENPDNLKNMRDMGWQAGLYKSVAEFLQAVFSKDSTLGDSSLLQDDIVEIFKTVSGLKDSLVKTQAQNSLLGLLVTLKANGFTVLAARLEAIK